MRSLRPPLTIKQILAWADTHFSLTGEWPNAESGPVADAPGEHWQNIDDAMRKGFRGFSGKRSLAQLLIAKRGVWKRAYAPKLTVQKILRWADQHHRRTSAWPHRDSGPVNGDSGETWQKIDLALQKGIRGLNKSTLPQLLAQHRDVRNIMALPPLTEEQILWWMDAHKERTGKWPSNRSGLVQDAPGESWNRLDNSLKNGLRGLSGGLSLSRLLAENGTYETLPACRP